jgi:hypothetical protein
MATPPLDPAFSKPPAGTSARMAVGSLSKRSGPPGIASISWCLATAEKKEPKLACRS